MNWNEFDHLGDEGETKFKNPFQKALFSVLNEVLNWEETQVLSSRKQKILYTAKSFLYTAQFLSLLWFSDSEIKNWSNYYLFWKVLECFRLDTVFSLIGQLRLIAIVFMVLKVVFVAELAIITFKIWNKKKPPSLLLFITRYQFHLFANMYRISFLVVSVTVVKYSLIEADTIREFDNLPTSELNFGFWGVFEILGFLLISSVCYLNDLLYYENRHFYKEYPNSRSFSSIVILKFYFEVSGVLFYAVIGTYHEVTFRYLVILFAAVIAYKFLRFRPFFNEFSNALAGVHYGIIVCFSLALQVGEYWESAHAALIIAVLLSPIASYLQVSWFYYSLNNRYHSFQVLNSSELEHKIRDLIQNYPSETVIATFSNLRNIKVLQVKKFLTIWETNYCLDFMKDQRLARIKLSRAKNQKGDLESDFMAFRCSERISQNESEYYEDIDFIRYNQSYLSLREKDEVLCYAFLDLLKELSSNCPKKAQIEKLIGVVCKLIKKLDTSYEYVTKNYSKCPQGLFLYGTYLSDVCGKFNKSAKVLQNRQNLLSKHQNSQNYEISFFDDSNGVMVVSGDPNTLGRITYANYRMCELLSISLAGLIGSDLSSFVPYPFNRNHNQAMQRFLDTCYDTEIKLPISLFLQNPSGYLVECYIMIKCTAEKASPFFIVLAKKRRSSRQIALIDDLGVILGHSKQLRLCLGRREKDLRNKCIEELVPGVVLSELVPFKPLKVCVAQKTIALVLAYKLIKEKEFKFMFFITDKEEIKRWVKGLETECTEFRSSQSREFTQQRYSSGLLEDLEEQKEALSGEIEREFNDITVLEQDPKSSKVLPHRSSGTKDRTVENSSNTQNSSGAIAGIKPNQISDLKRQLNITGVLSVVFLLAILGGNVFLLMSSYSNIKDSEESENYLRLSDIHNCLFSVLDSTRKLQLESDADLYIDASQEISNIELHLGMLQETYSFLKQIKNEKCDLHSYLVADQIQVYEYLSSTPRYVNVLDFVQSILVNCEELISKHQQNLPAKQNEVFIQKNLLSGGPDYLKKIIHLLEDCEMAQVEQLSLNILPWIVVEISVIGLCLFVLVFYITRVDTMFKKLWKSLMKHTRLSIHNHTQKILQRLSMIHENQEVKPEFEPKFKTKKKVRFAEKWKFLKVVILVCGLCLVYTSSFVFLIETLSVNQLVYEKTILKKNVRLRYLSKELSFWTRESILSTTDSSIEVFLQDNLFFSYPRLEFNSVRKSINSNLNDILFSMLRENVSDDIKDIFFSKRNTWKVFSHGLYKGIQMVATESQDLVSSNKLEMEVLYEFDKSVYYLEELLNQVFQSLQREISEKLDFYFNIFIWATVLYSLVVFGVLLVLFLPLIKKEKLLMKHILKLLKLFERSKTTNK